MHMLTCGSKHLLPHAHRPGPIHCVLGGYRAGLSMGFGRRRRPCSSPCRGMHFVLAPPLRNRDGDNPIMPACSLALAWTSPCAFSSSLSAPPVCLPHRCASKNDLPVATGILRLRLFCGAVSFPPRWHGILRARLPLHGTLNPNPNP